MLTERQLYGLMGEREVYQRLSSCYNVMLLSDFCNDVDLIVEGLLKVEVKTARPRLHKAKSGVWRKRYQFNLQGLPKDEEILVICLCDTPNGLIAFFIPSSVLTERRRKHLQITSHPTKYKGWAATFLENWTVIEELLSIKRKNSVQLMLPLFGGIQ